LYTGLLRYFEFNSFHTLSKIVKLWLVARRVISAGKNTLCQNVMINIPTKYNQRSRVMGQTQNTQFIIIAMCAMMGGVWKRVSSPTNRRSWKGKMWKRRLSSGGQTSYPYIAAWCILLNFAVNTPCIPF